MKDEWELPKNHPITIERAKELIKGDLPVVCMEILKSCCAPFYWVAQVGNSLQIVNNGTITFLKTSKKIIGITAAHVFRGYEEDFLKHQVQLFIMDGRIDNLSALTIDVNDKLDLATFNISEKLLNSLGKNFSPVSPCQTLEPVEGRGIMLAGYPGQDIKQFSPQNANFGLFTALGTARRVSEVQITWVADRGLQNEGGISDNLPPHYDLGGISGGPLICWFETPNYISYFMLAGIISQANRNLENVISKRISFINADGKITNI